MGVKVRVGYQDKHLGMGYNRELLIKILKLRASHMQYSQRIHPPDWFPLQYNRVKPNPSAVGLDIKV